ncbi:MAG TPA: methyl-accepting chemotaxis protein [Gemmatimonadaceae bacterium]
MSSMAGSSAPSRARGAARLTAHVARLPFGEKLSVLSTIAGIALGLVILLNIIFGAVNGWQLQRVETEFRAVQAGRDLRDGVAGVSDALRAAVSARDAAPLGAADTIARNIARDLDGLRASLSRDRATLDSLDAATRGYVTAGRWAATQLIADASSDSLVRALDAAAQHRRDAGRLLEQLTASSEREAAAAGTRARRSLWTGWIASGVVALVALLVLLRLFRTITRAVVDPVREAAHSARRIARGELDELPQPVGSDELAELQRAMREMAEYLQAMARTAGEIAQGHLGVDVVPRSERDVFGIALAEMTAYLRRMAGTAERIAQGDLSARVAIASDRDTFGQSFELMTTRLSAIMGEIHGGTSAITQAAEHLTHTAQRLSESVAAQGERVQLTEERLGQMEELIRQNAAASRRAAELSAGVADRAEVSGEAVRDTLAALEQVTQTVGAIQAMSDESNLLALNAAIEAARVGAMGLGFAVVADGMRSLAEDSGRSARRAHEITIESRVVAERAGALVRDLLPTIRETAALVGGVTEASAEQASRVDDVAEAMREVTTITGANAEGAEQLAATAEELTAQAESLRDLVRFFTIREQPRAPAAAPPPAGGPGGRHAR